MICILVLAIVGVCSDPRLHELLIAEQPGVPVGRS